MIDDGTNSRLASLVRLYKKFVELDSRVCCNPDGADYRAQEKLNKLKNDIFMQMKFFMTKERVGYLMQLGPEVSTNLMWIYARHKLIVSQEKHADEFGQE